MRLAVAVLSVLASLFVPGYANAAQVFSCGGAEVRIEIVANASPLREERAVALLTVRRAQAVTVLRYLNIDFIGGQCVVNAASQALVVFQAYCGGSGCKDGDNWGIVDPQTLRVLTVPSDTNRNEALALIGGDRVPTLEMLSVHAEARKPGMHVPDGQGP